MAERRQFPVEHREQTRLIGVEDHVVDAPVAVHQRDAAVVGGDMARRARRSDGPCRRPSPFRWPCTARSSAAAGGRNSCRACRSPKGRRRRRRSRAAARAPRSSRHRSGGALLARQIRQRRIPEDAAVDMRHEIKRRADRRSRPRTAPARAAPESRRPPALAARETRARPCARFQQFARRLAPQHVAPARRLRSDRSGSTARLRISSPARAGEARDMRARPGVEARVSSGKAAAHCARSRWNNASIRLSR